LPGDGDDSPTAQIEVDFPAMMRDSPKPPMVLKISFSHFKPSSLSIQTIFSFNPLEIKEKGAIRVRG
jgi:hypothetical protein